MAPALWVLFSAGPAFATGGVHVHPQNLWAGLPEEAVRSFERATRVNPVDPMLHVTFAGMGMAFIELRRFDEAIAAGKKAQRQNPSHGAAYRCLVSAYAEAHETAARMLELDPALYNIWVDRSGWAIKLETAD
jgi:adenylate cyclase